MAETRRFSGVRVRRRTGRGHRQVDLHERATENGEHQSRPAGNPTRSGRAAHVSERRMDCLICKIIARESPASIVYEDERVIAFNDINPQAPTHVLILPKRHIETLNVLEPDDDQLVGELARRAAAIDKERGISEKGYGTVFNTNPEAGQTVFHIHLHLVGGRPMTWPPG